MKLLLLASASLALLAGCKTEIDFQNSVPNASLQNIYWERLRRPTAPGAAAGPVARRAARRTGSGEMAGMANGLLRAHLGAA